MKKIVRGVGMLLMLGILFSSACGPVADVQYPDGPTGQGIAYMALDRQSDVQSKVATPYTWKCGQDRYSFDVFVTVSSVSASKMFFRNFTIVAKAGTVGILTMDLWSQAGNVLHQSPWPDTLHKDQVLDVPVNKWVNSLPAVLEIGSGFWFNNAYCTNKALIRFTS